MANVEYLGLTASALIVISMVFKTTTYKGTLLMRFINMIGSIFFVLYGLKLPAMSTAIANIILFFINLFYLYKEINDHKELEEAK